jgi:gamma-glutamylcyclotransferase (GGCT)/AIG2-like uncharacterized protein YtfP
MTLFFYGTLLPDLVRPPIAAAVARLRPLGPAKVPGRLYDLGPYPGLVPDAGGQTRVAGELFAADEPDLVATLDDYEGSEFRRVPTTAATPAGGAVACWVYEYVGDVSGAVVVAGGDWRRWVGSALRLKPPHREPR